MTDVGQQGAGVTDGIFIPALPYALHDFLTSFNTSTLYLLTRETVDLDPRVLRVEVARLEARHVEAGRGEVVEGTAHRLLG